MRSIYLVLLLISANPAFAEVLCLKASQKVSKGTVSLSDTLKVFSGDKCGKGFKQVLATKSFQGTSGADGIDGAKGDKGEKGETGLTGAKGDTGATGSTGAQGIQGVAGTAGKGVGDAFCTQRSFNNTYIINSSNKVHNTVQNFTCNSDEFLHLAIADFRETYSNDWSVDGDSSQAGDDLSVTQVAMSSELVVDVNKKYLIGMRTGTADYSNSTITGSRTVNNDHHLTCCKLQN